MMRKKSIFLIGLAILLGCPALPAQTTRDEYLARYERLVRNVGYAGVGVETLIDRWEEDFPDDISATVARFNYYFIKSQRTEMLVKEGTRFLGNPPQLTLKDENGADVNYFAEDFYDETYFSEAIRVLDSRMAEFPDELRFHFLKISALSAYEKESPDLAAAEVKALIDRNASARPAWTLDGEPVDGETFQQAIGEYCYNFFQTGTPASYAYFLDISTRMNKLYPKNPVYLDNIGSYWLVVKEDDKQAAKYYKKALKLSPDDYAAQSNLQLIERRKAAAKGKR